MPIDFDAELADLNSQIVHAHADVENAEATLRRLEGARNFALLCRRKLLDEEAAKKAPEPITDAERAQKILSIANAPRKPAKKE